MVIDILKESGLDDSTTCDKYILIQGSLKIAQG